jgi:transcriptional regulator with XRE-family HTH domain
MISNARSVWQSADKRPVARPAILGQMDDLAFGRLIRLTRIARRWRQVDLAARAKVSPATVSRVERGHLGEIPLATIRAIADALGIRVQIAARARAVDLDRVLNARHAALAGFCSEWIGSLGGWVVRPEASYSEFGERGAIDLLCWHAASRCLLVVEIKTEIVELGELLSRLDAKERLGPVVGRRLGWAPVSVSACLLVADSVTNRRRVVAHGSLLHAAFPTDGRALGRWLKRPSGSIRALRFVSDSRPGHARSDFAGPTLIRLPRRPARTA